MDPLTACSIAAAVVQFVDFGTRLLSESKDVYGSVTGQSQEKLELSQIGRDLVTLCDDADSRLQKARQSGAAPASSDSVAVFTRICAECRDINQMFQDALSKLQARGTTKIGKGASSLWVVLKGLWSAKDIEKLKSRLNDVRQQMMMGVLVCLWGEANNAGLDTRLVAKQQAELVKTVKEMDETTRKFCMEVRDMLTQGSQTGEHKAAGMVQYIVESTWRPEQSMIDNAQDPAKNQRNNKMIGDIITSSLLFDTMTRRREAVSDAFANTYQWIFNEPPTSGQGPPLWSSFPDWARGPSDRIYWVTGKPGAGKSTLLKFILGDPRLSEHLHAWAGDSPLVMATYYSWNAGDTLQKSHNGLLRTLLHQCLEWNPEMLVPELFPNRWALLQVFENSMPLPAWSTKELRAGFMALAASVAQKLQLKIVFVIDGLDEFLDEEHIHLVELLHEANLCPNIKICASSRPWNIFRDAFRQSPMLRLQDLTQKDIVLYVNGHFRQSEGFRELEIIYPSHSKQLMDEIVEKASGVFLWVSVVVRALLENFREGDKLSDLRATLQSLPLDISDLFTVIWSRTNCRYHGEASQYFLLLKGFKNLGIKASALSMWLGDDEYPPSMDLDGIEDKEEYVTHAIASLKRRVNSRTKGLLEVYTEDDGRKAWVEYMHRTALEWVTKNWDTVQATSKPNFDPYLWIFKGETLRLQFFNDIVPIFMPADFWTTLSRIIHCATKVSDSVPANTNTFVQTLDRLDSQVRELFENKSTSFEERFLDDWVFEARMPREGVIEPRVHWSNRLAALSKERIEGASHTYWIMTDFVGVMAQVPVPQYVKAKISNNPDILRPKPQTVSILHNVVFGVFSDSHFYRAIGPFRTNLADRVELLKIVLGHEEHLDLDVVESVLFQVQRRVGKTIGGLGLSKKESDSLPTDWREVLTEPRQRDGYPKPIAKYYAHVEKLLRDFVERQRPPDPKVKKTSFFTKRLASGWEKG